MGDAGRHGHPGARPSRWSAAKKGGLNAQTLSRSRGGFGTKIHVCVDPLGLPVCILLEPRQPSMSWPTKPMTLIASIGRSSNKAATLSRRAVAIAPWLR